MYIFSKMRPMSPPTADNTGPLRTQERKPPPRRPTTTPKAYLTASVTRHHDHNHTSASAQAIRQANTSRQKTVPTRAKRGRKLQAIGIRRQNP